MMTPSAWVDFSTELDAAIQAHMQWSHRVLRCAVLHASPGGDLLETNAHELCGLGQCFTRNRAFFEVLDGQMAQALESNHREMHGAIREICNNTLTDKPGSEDSLRLFEATQLRLIEYLSHFKTLSTQINSQIDPLTGLALRHRLEPQFELLKKRCSRQGNSVAIMIIDIDHFKSVNDQHGHMGGDLVLKEIAKCLKSSIREGDEAYRYGGDELLVLLELRNSEEAILAGRRLLNTIRRQSVVFTDGSSVQTTATIGVAKARNTEGINDVLQRADAALYQGKARGRNCYVVANDGGNDHPGHRLAS